MGPTEPAALTAASLLVASTVEAQGGPAGTSAWPGHAQLSGLVQRVTADRQVGTVLDEAIAWPQDPAAVGALAQVLAALAAEDHTFRGELVRLVGQAEHDPAVGRLATTIAGHARVGKLVTIGHAGTVHVHLPAPLPQTLLDRLHRAMGSGPLVANLPPRNPTFTGREELLDRLHASLHPGQAAAVVQAQAQALHGLGGVGKTQLALEYAHAHTGEYDLIWWVVAEQPATIPGQLVALAHRLGIPEATDQAETIAVLYDELRGRGRWLLVLDNAEDPADLRPWWPPDSGRVLVTSRNPAWGGLAAVIALDVLPRGEAVAFLRRRLGRDDPAFDALAAALGDLPLALEQAAAYLDETSISIGDYLGLLRDRARELFALGRPATTEQTIATTWTVALQRLSEQTPAAEDLLCLCAFLAPDEIPRDLPTERPDLLPEPLASVVQDPLAYQQSVGALRRYSLATITEEAISLHRLVQTVVRHQLDSDQEQQWATVALCLIAAAMPAADDDPAAWPVHARLLPHVLGLGRDPVAVVVDPRTTAKLLATAGAYLWRRADLAQAHDLLERSVALCTVRLGVEAIDTARPLDLLGTVCRTRGELDRARMLHEQALHIREIHLGTDNLDTAWSLNGLALVLHAQGDLDGARTLHQRALAIREAHLGADHPDTARSLNGLAIVLYDQSDLTRARTLHQRALAIREAHLGPHHLYTAWSLDGLALVLHAQGDLTRACTLHQRALAIREAHLGADHPDTARSLNGLAKVLRDQGDLRGARTLYERALSIREARLGADHPDTVRSRQNLAAVDNQQ